MVFFTTPELLEIGNIPMTSLNEKPNRTEALKYYRRVADHLQTQHPPVRTGENIRVARMALSKPPPPTVWVVTILLCVA
jgi:hypothetical protein